MMFLSSTLFLAGGKATLVSVNGEVLSQVNMLQEYNRVFNPLLLVGQQVGPFRGHIVSNHSILHRFGPVILSV